MAIKGKRKPKARSGRAVTAGPRPAYVAPKVPPFQRTGAKFLVALIFEAAIFSLLVGFGEQSQADRQKERIGEFTALVEASLGQAGDAIQPLPGGAQVLPQLPSRLSQLEAGELGDEVAIPEAEDWASSLTGAADGVTAVQVPEEHLDPAQRLALTDARNLLERGLRMFVGLADEFRVAVQIDGAPQADLIASIQQQLAVASETFNAGYGKLQDVRSRAGLSTTASLPGGGLPAGGIPAGGIPGAPPGFDPTMPVDTTQVIPTDEGGGKKGGGKSGEGGNG